MSWDSYIDMIVEKGAGNCDKGCIIGKDGSPWTSTTHSSALAVGATEINAIKTGVVDPTLFQASGVIIGGQKYNFLRTDGDMILFKRKDFGAITMVTTKTAIVIGHTIEGGQQGSTNEAVSKVAEYLGGHGY